jgi:hypothetical protein
MNILFPFFYVILPLNRPFQIIWVLQRLAYRKTYASYFIKRMFFPIGSRFNVLTTCFISILFLGNCPPKERHKKTQNICHKIHGRHHQKMEIIIFSLLFLLLKRYISNLASVSLSRAFLLSRRIFCMCFFFVCPAYFMPSLFIPCPFLYLSLFTFYFVLDAWTHGSVG